MLVTQIEDRIVLHEDEHWLVVNKPTNISTHGAFPGDLAAVEWIKLHFSSFGGAKECPEIFVVSRLDKGTSGVLVFAKSKLASALAQKIHEQETSEKFYVFISNPVKSNATHVFPLEENSAIEEKVAHTKIWLLSEVILGNKKYHMYCAKIHRGRTHQIRIHAARLGFPILGDTEYGGESFPRLMLHCWQLHWPNQETPDSHIFTAPFPPSFGGTEAESVVTKIFEAIREGRAVRPKQMHLNAGLYALFPHDFVVGFAAACDRRLGWLKKVTSAYRLVHRKEIPLSCGQDFALDRYGDFLCFWCYSSQREQNFGFFGSPQINTGKKTLLKDHRALQAEEIFGLQMEALLQFCGADGAVIRHIGKNPHHAGLVTSRQYFGKAPPAEFVVEEHGCKYFVSLDQRQHIGLFLDQRDNRKRILLEAKGKRCLNLFSYSCAFSVCAAKAGCEVVFSVDAAATALKLGKRNFALNDLETLGCGKFVQEDVRKFLHRQLKKIDNCPLVEDKEGLLFDVIICDPPTFSSVEGRGSFSVEKDWEELVQLCWQVLKDNGIVYFSNNHRSGKSANYQAVLDRYFGKVESLSSPLDFPELDELFAKNLSKYKDTEERHVHLFRCVK